MTRNTFAQLPQQAPSSATARVLGALSRYSALQAGAVPFAETVIRFAPNGDVCLMSRQAGGWGAFSHDYASIWTLARAWRLTFVDIGRDEHSAFIRVVPGEN